MSEAQKLIEQLLQLIPPMRATVNLGIQPEAKDCTKNGIFMLGLIFIAPAKSRLQYRSSNIVHMFLCLSTIREICSFISSDSYKHETLHSSTMCCCA